MDAILPENISYLNLINDKNNSEMFLQNVENINNSESVFAEYIEGEPIWAIDGSTLVNDEIGETTILLNQADNNGEETSELGFPVEIPEKGIMTSSGLYYSNDLLLQLNLQNQDITEVKKSPVEILGQTIFKPNSSAKCITEQPIEVELENIIEIAENSPEQFQDVNMAIVEEADSEVEIEEGREARVIDEEGYNKKLLEYVEVVSVFKCRKCLQLFEDYGVLLNHLENECKVLCKPQVEKPLTPKIQKMSSLLKTDENKRPIVKDIYLCGMCENVGYETIADLRKHMINKHDLSYEDIDGTINDEENSKQKTCVNLNCYKSIIEMQKIEGKRIKCLVRGCDHRFRRVELMVRHYECHVEGEKKQFKCPDCDKIFYLWRLCSNHMYKCHNIDLDQYSCPLCNKYKSLSTGNLLAHMATHESPQPLKPFLCAQCGQDFKLLSQLKNHEAKHDKLEKDEETSSWIMKIKCTVCKKFFSNTKALKKHVQTVHNKFKPFICNICGHKCSRKSMLELHLRQHTGEKPYKCDICVFKTGDHNSLRRHKLRHLGESQYSCPHCDYKTIQSRSMINHIKRKHPGKEGFYNCPLCPFNSVSEQLHMDHMKEHEINGVSLDNLKNKSPDSLKLVPNMEDEETQPGIFADHMEDATIDTGGITIPAESDVQIEETRIPEVDLYV